MRTLSPASAGLGLVAGLVTLLGVAGPATARDGQEPVGDAETREASSFGEAFTQGALSLDLRYRFELVEDEAFEKQAYASTLRSALAFETAPLQGFFAGALLENVTAIGNDTLYNNAGAGRLWNGVTDRPLVPDPALTEIDRAYLGYRGPLGLEIRAGRFDYSLDNTRFVGIGPWRQSHRSYGGVSAALGRPSGWHARYAFLDRVHYNNDSSPGLAGHLAHVSRSLGVGRLSAYAYLLDWEDEARARFSSATFGARLAGSRPWGAAEVLYHAEYARQVDYGSHPGEFGLDYVHLGAGVRRGAWSVEIGWELKDGDGVNAVQTPIASNHGKNGFADRLVVTSPEGSHDRYVRLRMDRDRWAWLVAYHDFRAATESARLGRELDAQVRVSATGSLSFHGKMALYWADTLSTDTNKIMVWARLGLDLF